MIRSMTGFAARSLMVPVGESKVSLSLSIKSLNARYFDATCKLPAPLSHWEIDFIKLLKSKLFRGSITFSIHIANQHLFKGVIEPSLSTIKNYLHALDTIKKTCDIEGSLSIANLLLLPNIFTTQEQELSEDTKKIIFQTIDILLDELIAMETKEGEALEKDLFARIAIINQEMNAIEHAFEKHMAQQKQKISNALADLEQDTTKFAENQKNILYTILDKIDVHEEIVRFKNHIKTLQASLDTAEIEKGKRIDFILQELSREINTITAKCSDGSISSHAINIKVELEKAREQTQNIV